MRRVALFLTLLGTLTVASAEAAPSAAPASASPPGASAAPPAHASAAPAPPPAHGNAAPEGTTTLPAGHPGAANEPPADVSEASPSIPRNTIEATVVDETGMPVAAGTPIRLGILFQKIAEGESRSERFTNADGQGTARFSDLSPGSDRAYRVTITRGNATYATPPFNLRQDMGQRVLLHVYPSTTDIERAMVGMRGYLYIETRDDVFQCEVLFRVFNVGRVTWVPDNVVMRLPSGFKAFKANESMTDVRFELDEGRGAKLKGTFSPGEQQASFRFQVPKENSDSAQFHVGLPPHVAEMRVIAEASANMNLEVEGFDKPVPAANNNGQRVLVSVKQLRRRDEEIKDFTASLTGIPVPGPGRWVALIIALSLGVGGVFAANGAFDGENAEKNSEADRKRARDILLRELVLLERAFREQRIGPRSFEQSKGQLLDAVARLGLVEERPRAGRKSAKTAGRKRPKAASERG